MATVLLFLVVILPGWNRHKKLPVTGKHEPTKISAERAVRIAEEFIHDNGYTDYTPADISSLDLDLPDEMTEGDRKFLSEYLANRKNSIRPHAYGWKKGRRNDPNGWTIGFELVRTLENDPTIGQAVEMDEYGDDVWVEHMGFYLKSLTNRL